MNVTIYGLSDPRQPGLLWYVGRAVCPERRYRAHCAARWRGRGRKDQWIALLYSCGLKPSLHILANVPTDAEAIIAEQFWIDKARAQNPLIFNVASAQGEKPRGFRRKVWLPHACHYMVHCPDCNAEHPVAKPQAKRCRTCARHRRYGLDGQKLVSGRRNPRGPFICKYPPCRHLFFTLRSPGEGESYCSKTCAAKHRHGIRKGISYGL